MSKYIAVHGKPQGPGDARPTAQQIVEDEEVKGKLAGKTIFITGANQGIGFETVRALRTTGATIFLGVRDLKKGQQAVEDLRASNPNNGAPLHLIELSLNSLNSVRAAAQAFLAQRANLNILILNAGVMATPEGKTVDGFETQFGINHLGHFLLFQLLKPALLAAATPSFTSRVISLSSLAHRVSDIRFHDLNFEEEGSYEPWVAYGQSKSANIYMATEIDKRYGPMGVHALSLHPGTIATNLGQYVDPKAVEAMVDDQVKLMMKSAPQGAATTVYAAISKDWEGRGGRYLSDCGEPGPAKPSLSMVWTDVGHAPWVYDEHKAAKLWFESCKLVGIEDNA
ncbi:hypothetical protein FVEN_g9617 [Fusarium venenatum]|uniref:WW domain-containing oxidoreductase n=2 Tax=Fusarium venenatum TaxID=56646 RepID=A0A2L2TRN3_9HYPO|nr:uncharacterized protein FVRRES_04329 [Fusarium venenatum]KAG8352463.1 hypothetical protein FVEN_g9617 [Fusarium venenatum]CEI67817.1 unnamed protein product [Fusarium venenatum]